jgi:acyl dehydratase
MRVFPSLSALQELAGQELAVTDWIAITQDTINTFADATGDHQWIHVDPERCAKDSPYGKPIAHGLLSLSLFPKMMESSLRIEGIQMAINYGLNKVRFTAPVPVDSRLRGRLRLLRSETLEQGTQLYWEIVMELEGSTKPACVAEAITRCY